MQRKKLSLWLSHQYLHISTLTLQFFDCTSHIPVYRRLYSQKTLRWDALGKHPQWDHSAMTRWVCSFGLTPQVYYLRQAGELIRSTSEWLMRMRWANLDGVCIYINQADSAKFHVFLYLVTHRCEGLTANFRAC